MRIEPGHPEQNGSHERMHRTLKAETVRPPAADVQAQQKRFDAFRCEFNQERPHQALGMQTPGSLYVACEREMPERIAAAQYGGHCEVRRVRGNGILYFADRTIFLSELLIGQDVGLEEIEEGVWSIYFYDLLLARLDARRGNSPADAGGPPWGGPDRPEVSSINPVCCVKHQSGCSDPTAVDGLRNSGRSEEA